MRAVLFDFGGVLLLTPFELCRAAERSVGLEPGTLDWTGPFDPAADPAWRRFQAGEMTERDYWNLRVTEFGALTGQPGLDVKGMFSVFYDQPEDVLIRGRALPLVRALRAAGIHVGILTNDLRAFHGDEWCARITVLGEVDAMVDGSLTHILKPDGRAYALAAEALGVGPDHVVFVDDQPINVAGAAAAGMATVHFDVTDPDASFRVVAEMMGVLL